MTTKVRPEPKVPDHEVLRKIGGGAYGEVWLARGVTGAMRAVKVVWRDDFDDERGFEREFEGIRKYEPVSGDHPGLVNILHIGRSESEGEDFYYYVMELGDDIHTGREINPVEYEARNLRTDMKAAAGEPLDVEQCIEVGHAVAEGLRHLHENGLAHRDVKPSNIIFVDGKAKLADIGLVAFRDQLTFVGTEGFVPPEGPGSAQADVYSLGKVLYEMVTGKDRLDFPELPDQLPTGKALRKWRAVNAVICDICEPRASRRRIKTAEELANELARLERGKGRTLRLRAAPVLFLILAMLAVLVVWQLPLIKTLLKQETGEDLPLVGGGTEEVQYARVTIVSTPLGAGVYDEDGRHLGDTPFRAQPVAVGSEISLTFRMEGHRTTSVTTLIEDNTEDDEQPRLVIGPILEIYAPPVIGDPWSDILGMTYKAVDDYHSSVYYVGKAEWDAYLEELEKKPAAAIVQVDELGSKRQAVFTSPAEATGFADWLRQKLGSGYLTADHILEARMDLEQSFKQLPGKVERNKWRPFRIEVRRIPYALVQFTSNPPGAAVYLDGDLRGETPLLGEAGREGGLRVRPGKVEMVLEAEGFKPIRRELVLADDEVWSEPLHLNLEKSAGVVFGRTWTNSLKMSFVPLGDDLMVSVFETRVEDYMAFVRAAGLEPAPNPGFEQGLDHPVVNVSPEDARRFCDWLTEKERREELIAQNHRYRLPSDLEWSAMAGLPLEEGEWPGDRAAQPEPGYPWGDGWPPPQGAGNYADESAVTLGNMKAGKQVPDYDDGAAFTAPVGSYGPSGLGLYDLGGNVHEWVEDPYGPDGEYAVSRGGGWNSYQSDNLTSSFRIPVGLDGTRDEFYGFRIVLAREELVPEEDAEVDEDDGYSEE